MLRAALVLLGLVHLGLWGAWYVYLGGQACACASTSAPCRLPMPWTLRGEDLLVMVAVPALVPLALFGFALLPRRKP